MKITVLALTASLAILAGDETITFTSSKAREAQKTYQKALERLKAEYDAKVKKAQSDYLKSLEAALQSAKKSKDSGEAARIEKAIEELKGKSSAPSGPEKGSKPSRAPEKGPDGVSFIGGDGESIEQAVVIKGAEDSPGAVIAEEWWLKKHCPGHTKAGQGLLHKCEKTFDAIEITTPDGKARTIYFDITECFGFPKE